MKTFEKADPMDENNDSPDPITGEPDAHPVSVGVGAALGGMGAGAALGALAGPIGAIAGAAVGGLVGGLAGHEAAASHPRAASSPDEPLPTASSGLITPQESSFLADSVSADTGMTGEAPLITESALTGAFASSAEAQSLEDDEQGEALPVDESSIREAAYYRFRERELTGAPGDEFDDWIMAERALR